VSEAVVAAGFLASTGYRQVHASPADYLFGLYADVLGCAPDPDGLAAWQAAAQAGLGRRNGYSRGEGESGEVVWVQKRLVG
jgi:hypothetical protein